MNHPLIITPEEQRRRLDKVVMAMQASGIRHALIGSNVNIYYLTGRVFAGYIYITPDARIVYLIKRPAGLAGADVAYIRKPEDIPDRLRQIGFDYKSDTPIGLELGYLDYNSAIRLGNAMAALSMLDISPAIAAARSQKTPYEIELIRRSARIHAQVYARIPDLYKPGMTDIDLQIEIEGALRKAGCLGAFRIAGQDMELHMASILAGDNADTPSPYDFAMGGAGCDPSLPVGANGSPIRPGESVMVDANGNFTGYMDDMTRTYACATLPQKALDAHSLSIDICHELQLMGRPGTEAKAMYAKALEMAQAAGFADYFMGHRQKAGFVGHGVGIEINELPVLAPRSRHILAEGNVIAVEPKFVIPGVGAVGIENTYAVTADGPMECLTVFTEPVIQL